MSTTHGYQHVVVVPSVVPPVSGGALAHDQVGQLVVNVPCLMCLALFGGVFLVTLIIFVPEFTSDPANTYTLRVWVTDTSFVMCLIVPGSLVMCCAGHRVYKKYTIGSPGQVFATVPALTPAVGGPYPVVPAGGGPLPVVPAGVGPYPVVPAGGGAHPVVPAGVGPYPVAPAGVGPYPVAPAGAAAGGGGEPYPVAPPTTSQHHPSTQVTSSHATYAAPASGHTTEEEGTGVGGGGGQMVLSSAPGQSSTSPSPALGQLGPDTAASAAAAGAGFYYHPIPMAGPYPPYVGLQGLPHLDQQEDCVPPYMSHMQGLAHKGMLPLGKVSPPYDPPPPYSP